MIRIQCKGVPTRGEKIKILFFVEPSMHDQDLGVGERDLFFSYYDSEYIPLFAICEDAIVFFLFSLSTISAMRSSICFFNLFCVENATASGARKRRADDSFGGLRREEDLRHVQGSQCKSLGTIGLFINNK